MKTRLFILFLALAMQVVCADAVIKTIDEENIIDMCVSADKKTTTVIYYKEKKGILFKEKGYYVLQNDTLFGPYDKISYSGIDNKEYWKGHNRKHSIFLWEVRNKEGSFMVSENGVYKSIKFESKRGSYYDCYIEEKDHQSKYFLTEHFLSIASEISLSDIQYIVISPDKKRIGVVTSTSDVYGRSTYCLYIDEDKKLSSEEPIYGLQFSPNSEHFVYCVEKKDNEYMHDIYLDGKAVGHNLDVCIENEHFLENNELFFYNTIIYHHDNGYDPCNYKVHIGNRAISLGDNIPKNPISLPNGKKIAFIAGNCLYIEDEKIACFNEIQDIHFYADNETVIYKAMIEEKWYVCANREKAGPFKDVTDLTLSPNRENIAWVARHEDGLYYVHTPETEAGPYHSVGKLIFSSDNQALFYRTEEGESYYDSSYYLILGEKRLGPFDKVHKYLFASDGKTPVYITRQNNYPNASVHIGDKKFASYRNIDKIIFVQDYLDFCYHDTVEGVDYIDTTKGRIGPFDNIENINFTPSGKALSFSTKINSIPYMKVAFFEGGEVQVYTGSFYNGHLLYVKDGKIMIREEEFEKK